MTPDDVTSTPDAAAEAAATVPPVIAPHIAGTLHADAIQANLSAIASVQATTLSATGSAIGVADIDGDATITASWVPILRAKGNATFQQSYANGAIIGGDTTVHQAGAPIIVGKSMDINQGGGGVLITGEADIKQGWVGVVISPKTTISEDSRVLISTKAALIIAAAIFGGFGLIAVLMVVGAKRAMGWRPQVNLRQMPSLAEIHERIQQLRHAS